MNIQYEIVSNWNKTFAVVMDKDKQVAYDKVIQIAGGEAKTYWFELRVTQRGEMHVTYFAYAELDEEHKKPGVVSFDVNKMVKATVVEGSLDELMNGAATASFQIYMKANLLIWDVSKAFLLLEDNSDPLTFYLPIK